MASNEVRFTVRLDVDGQSKVVDATATDTTCSTEQRAMTACGLSMPR